MSQGFEGLEDGTPTRAGLTLIKIEGQYLVPPSEPRFNLMGPSRPPDMAGDGPPPEGSAQARRKK